MKTLLLALAMLVSSAGLEAQVPLSTRMAEGTKALTAGVKNFFVPTGGRYAGWQNIAASIVIAGLACTGLNGCSVKYKEEQRPQIELLQDMGKWGGGITTGVMLAFTLYIDPPDHRGENFTFFRDNTEPLYILIPLSVFVASHLWDASTYYVGSNGKIYAATPEQQDTLAASDAELRNYFREHLTPSTYRHVFADAAYEEDWVAVPIQAEFFNQENSLAGVVTSLEQADTIYYGRMTKPSIFTLDALKHKADNKLQLLAEERVLSVVVPSEGQ